MNEWASLLLVFWLLWLVDGWRLPPVARFGVTGWKRVRLHFARLLPPPWLPTGWSTVVADIPFALSPAGIANRACGAAGRPTDAPAAATGVAWTDIKEVTTKDGWIEINGRRFCRDTGHLSAKQLLELAREPEATRPARIVWWMRRWLRPAHLRRRVRVLLAHSSLAATTNVFFLAVALLVTAYLVGQITHRLTPYWAGVGGHLWGLFVIYLALLHLIGVVGAWLALRRLKAVQPGKRGSSLFTALLLPPQALRLRAVLADGYFPAQHPLAFAFACAKPAQVRTLAFDTLSDLRWPLGTTADAPLAQEIATWFRAELTKQLAPHIRAAGIKEAELFAAPVADGPTSVSYCPRCRSQFTAGRTHCPEGIALLPVAKEKS